MQKQVYKFLELLSKSAAIHRQEILTKKMNPYVGRTLEIIRQNAYKNISVASIADQLSINRSYLSRLFQQDIGCSIKEYINEIRITISCDLLSSTDYSITEISEKVGFANSQSFSKAFKLITGISPTIYRKKRVGLGRIRKEE